MKKKKLAATSFIILSSLVTLVSATSVSLTQPKNIEATNPKIKEKYVYEDMPAYKINDVVLYGANKITVLKNKYSNLLDAIWDQGKILAYDPAWGFVSSHFKIETPDINLTTANEKVVTISVVGSNGKKVSKNITLNVVDTLPNDDPHNLKGTASPYLFTQNLAMYKQFSQSNFVDQDWQPLVRQSLQAGDVVRIRQTNPKFVNAIGNQTLKFWAVPGVYQRTQGSGNYFVFKTSTELTNNWVNFTMPEVQQDTDRDQIKRKDIKHFGLLLNTPNFYNLAQENWPTFEYQIVPKKTDETLKNAPWLVFQNIENIKDKARVDKVTNWNIQKEAEFKKYWNDNPDLTNAIVSDNTFLLQLSGYARNQLKDVNIWKTSRGNQLVYDQYSRFVGMDFDDVNNPNNKWWNTPIAARSILILSGHNAGSGAVSGVATFADGSNISDMLGDSVLIRHEWGHLHQGTDKFSKNSELTETTNMVMGTLVNLFHSNWATLSNTDLIWNYQKAKGASDSWLNLLIKLNSLQSQLGSNTYKSIDAYNELRSVPIFQIFKQTSPELWVQTSRLIREYYGFVKADPRRTNAELSSAGDDKVNQVKAQRLAIWSKKYPPLANNPDFWDFLTYLAIKNYKKDFSNVLNKIGIQLADAVKKYGIEQGAEDVFSVQDIMGENLSPDFYKKIARVSSIYDWTTKNELVKLGVPFNFGNLSFKISLDDKSWMVNKKIYLYKRGALVKIFNVNNSSDNTFEEKGLEPGFYTLVFPQKTDSATKYELEDKSFYLKNGINNNFIFHYNKTQNNLKNASNIRFLGSNHVFGVNISYDPNSQSITFDSKTNAPHHREGGYYGFVLRDKTTSLYATGKTEINFNTNYYKFMTAKAKDGVNNVFINNIKLDPTKLNNGDYELWLFHVEGDSLMRVHNEITGNESRISSEDLSKVNGSSITSNITPGDSYFFTRIKIDKTNGFEILKNNSSFQFEASKAANYTVASDTVDDKYYSDNMDFIANKLVEITNNFNQKDTSSTDVDDSDAKDTLNYLVRFSSYLTDDFKSKNTEKLKKVYELITKLQNLDTIYIEEVKPLEVAVNKPFSPYEFIRIVSSKDGTVLPNKASVVETNIRVNKEGQYYVSDLGTYNFKFKVTNNSVTKEFTIQIKALKSLENPKAVAVVDNHQNPYKMKLSDYNKNVLYSNLNKNRTIAGTDYYISVFFNSIQKVSFTGTVLNSINVSNSSINNVEKIVVDNNMQYAYVLVSNNINGTISTTKVLKIQLYDFYLMKTYDTPDGIDNIGFFNNKVLLWKTADDTSRLKNNSAIYDIDVATEKISIFKLNDNIFNRKNYITNIFHIDGAYTYQSYDRNEDGSPKNLNYKTFTFGDAYILFMINSEGNTTYIVVDQNFKNITQPKILPTQSWLSKTEGPLALDDFTLNPDPISVSNFSYSATIVGNSPSPLAKYASQNIKKYDQNKFSYSGFPNYFGNNAPQASTNETIVNISNKILGGYFYDSTRKDIMPVSYPTQLIWDSSNSLSAKSFGKTGALAKKDSIGDSVSPDGTGMLLLPISQDVLDYKDYKNTLDASNWFILYDQLERDPKSKSLVLNSTKVFDYKSLTKGNLDLNNLTARLTRVDSTHFILGFFNSELKFGLTFDKTNKTMTAVKISSDHSFKDFKFDNYLQTPSEAQNHSDKFVQKIDQVTNHAPRAGFSWETDPTKGILRAYGDYHVTSWIDKRDTRISRVFEIDGLIGTDTTVKYQPENSYLVSLLKSEVPSKITIDELMRKGIVAIQKNLSKDQYKIVLEPNDTDGTLKITTTIGDYTKSITYSGFMKPNKDFYWIPPLAGQKIPEVNNVVSKEEVQKLFKVNEGTTLTNFESNVKGNLLNVKLNLTKDEKPRIYSTSFLIDPSKPAVEPVKPKPTEPPKKQADQPVTPGTTPVAPKKPDVTPVTPKTPETKPDTPKVEPKEPKTKPAEPIVTPPKKPESKPDTPVVKPIPEKPVPKPVTPVVTPTKPVTPPKEPKTKPVTPVVTPPVVTPTTPSLSSLNIKSLSAKIVDDSIEIKVDFDHFDKSDNNKLVTIKIVEKDNNKIIDKIVPLNKNSIMFSFDNLDKTKKYAIKSIELEKSPMDLTDAQKVLPEFKNKQSSTVTTAKTPDATPKDENKAFPLWIIGPIAGGTALIASILFFLFKLKRRKKK